MLKLPEKCFQLLPFRMKALQGIFPGLELCTQQGGAGGVLGKQDGEESRMAGKEKTLVYLLQEAMLENKD